jgi:replication factor C subunit 2/4
VLELNASDERGIRVVREKIKSFASMAINNTYRNIPPYKIIILDEADAMTNDSQFALRRIIEKYSNITRFILLCNYITKIISPLASRCAKFRFQPITYDQTKLILNNILKQENIENLPNDEVYKELYFFTEGDLRKSITIIQRAYFNDLSKKLTQDDIKEIIGDIDTIILNKINDLIFKNNKDDKFYVKLNKLINELLMGGYNIGIYINYLIKYTINNDNLTEKQKALINIKIAETNSSLDNGFNEYIQLLNLCSYIKLVNDNYCNTITYNPLTIDTNKIN